MMIAMVFFSFTEKLSATWASIRKQHKMRPTDQAHQSPCKLQPQVCIRDNQDSGRSFLLTAASKLS